MQSSVRINIADIKIGDRLRPASVAHVEALQASMAANGLRQPIEVTADNVLIAGLHRLEAAIALEWDEIDAFVRDVDDVQAQLLEVEENLVRHDLTVMDRALHVMRFRDLFEAVYGEISAGGNRQSADYKEEKHRGNLPLWSEDAAERLGFSGDRLKRLQRIAKLPSDVMAVLRDTGWDNNQKALLDLCGAVLPERQLSAVEILLDPDHDASTMREAIDAVSGTLRTSGDQLEMWLEKTTKTVLNAKKPQRIRLYKEQLLHDLDVFREAAKKAGFDLEPRREGPQK